MKRAPESVECSRCGASYSDPDLAAKTDAGDMTAATTCAECGYTPQSWKLVVVRGRWQEARGFRLALGRALGLAMLPIALLFGLLMGWGLTALEAVMPAALVAGVVLAEVAWIVARRLRKRRRAEAAPRL